MVTVALKKHIFADFLRGIAIRHLADKYSVSRRTIERWSALEGWVNQRHATSKRALDEQRRKIANEYAEKHLGLSLELYNQVIEMIAEREAFRMGKIKSRSFRYSYRDLRMAALALNELVKLDVQAAEVLSHRILKDKKKELNLE